MRLRLVFAPTILVGMTACGGGGGDTDAAPADASASCVLARSYQDFTSIQDNIFERQCAFMDCHDAGSPEANMDLTSATAHALLVNVDATLDVAQAQALKRVVPGSPATSYLMIILGDPRYPGPIDPDVGTMPQNSPLICQDKLDAIERWINAGALDD
jgi:hypothetical protein